MLTANLAGPRARVNTSLVNTCTITRAGSLLSPQPTMPDGTVLRCRVSLDGSVSLGNDLFDVRPRWRITLPDGLVLYPLDVLATLSNTYKVIEVLNPTSYSVSTTVYALELTDQSGVSMVLNPTATATILQYGATTDPDTGAPAISFTPFSPTYPCSIERDIRPTETDNAGRLTTTTYWLIRLPLAAKGHVSSKDRIAIGARTFEVLSPVDGSYDLVLPVLCVEVM